MNISNKRLFEVFNENSQDFYKNIENKDQKSEHWKTRYRLKEFTIENLIYFRSSDLSAGLDDSAGQTDLLSFRFYAEVVNQISEEYVLSNLPKSLSSFLHNILVFFADYTCQNICIFHTKLCLVTTILNNNCKNNTINLQY